MNKATIKRTTVIIVLLGMLAVHYGYSKEKSENDTALFKAAYEGDINEVTRLLKERTDMNVKDNAGKTALDDTTESEEANKEMIELLKEAIKNTE